MSITPAEILNDLDLAVDLVAKITGNIAAAKDVLSTDQLADARAKLATIQQQAADSDSAFDAAVSEAEGD